MWKSVDEAEGWQYLSLEYSSHDTEVHALKMYRLEDTITQSKAFAFKVITIAPPPPLISSKSLSRLPLTGKDANKVRTEIAALERLRGYAAVVELLEVLADEAVEELLANFMKRTHRKGRPVCLVLEYCPFRTLKEHISSSSMSQKEMIWLALQMWECLSALRESEILHRDLRSVNLMMCEGGRLKVIDFDCAFIRGFSNGQNLTFAFAEATTAPEVIHLLTAEEAIKGSMTNQEMYVLQEKCDLYSFGAILYEMVVKDQYGCSQGKIQILSSAVVSQSLKELICGLLKGVNQRLDYEQAEEYLCFLAQQMGLVYPWKRRKQTRQSLVVPLLDVSPSASSQSITNSVSLSDWSLPSVKDLSHRPTTRTTTIATCIPRSTLNE